MPGLARKCDCCGHDGLDERGTHYAEFVCRLCTVRGGFCLHNIQDHLGLFHYSRPGEHNGGDPRECPVCSEADPLAARGAG